MPNIEFEVRHNPTDTTVRIRSVRGVLANQIREIVSEAARLGADEARALAPRGPILARNAGRRIVDSIQEGGVAFHPGGAGGGGFYEATFSASGNIAPHLAYVMEGTAEQGAGKIHPARGNVLALQKEGEDVHFRAWVHGQRAQSEWWEIAQEETSRFVEARIADLHLPPES